MAIAARSRKLAELEANYERWMVAICRGIVTKERFNPELGENEIWYPGLAPHHRDLWEWAWQIELGVRPDPLAFVGIWARRGAKSNTVEMITAALAGRRKRKFAVYACGTQEQADDHLRNLQAIMESKAYNRAYPEAGRPKLTRDSKTQGWRTGRLEAANGFVAESIGMVESIRGINREGERPDLVIIDDVDQAKDSPLTTDTKLEVLRKAIIPSRTGSGAIIAVQNLILQDGVFDRIRKGELLLDRTMSGPIPALWNFSSDRDLKQKDGKWRITGGTPSWAGMDLAECEAEINLTGTPVTFDREFQHSLGKLSPLVHPDFNRMQHGISSSALAKADIGFLGGLDFGGSGFTANPSACLLGGVVRSNRAPGLHPGQLILLDEWKQTGPDIRRSQIEYMNRIESVVGRKIVWVADRTWPDAITILREADFTVVESLGDNDNNRETRAALVGTRLNPGGGGQPGLLYDQTRVQMWPIEMQAYKRMMGMPGARIDKRPIIRKNDHLITCSEYMVEYLDKSPGSLEVAVVRANFQF